MAWYGLVVCPPELKGGWCPVDRDSQPPGAAGAEPVLGDGVEGKAKGQGMSQGSPELGGLAQYRHPTMHPPPSADGRPAFPLPCPASPPPLPESLRRSTVRSAVSDSEPLSLPGSDTPTHLPNNQPLLPTLEPTPARLPRHFRLIPESKMLLIAHVPPEAPSPLFPMTHPLRSVFCSSSPGPTPTPAIGSPCSLS